MKDILRSKWSVFFVLVIIVTGLFSFRLLSDPDTGTHLRSGKWIVENLRVPDKDTFTYTCTDHDYLDSHWLFQVFVYGVYWIFGYNGLSVLVFLWAMLLFYLLMQRIQLTKGTLFITAWTILLGFLCMEPRITLRPEMFTFIFITIMLLVLDLYYHQHRKILFILPLVMLFWCNMHGLFILGFALPGAYFISICLRDRKPDWYFMVWMGLTILISLANPYTYKMLAFPFILNTRMSADNLFHQHIREMISFHSLDRFFFKDYIFIFFFSLTFLASVLTWKKRKIHEFILLFVFFYLAWTSIRNIALFAVIAIPILSASWIDFRNEKREVPVRKAGDQGIKVISGLLFLLSLLFVLGIGCRIFTNAYYRDNNSYYKTGMGVDADQFPTRAVTFLKTNHLEGRMINALGLGGWLGWDLQQPVFIDGRLEVIGEEFYSEVRNSWSGGLGKLIGKYDPSLIIYPYEKYYPWTLQLAGMPDWRLIYLDGFTAVFAKKGYAEEVPVLDLASIPNQFKISRVPTDHVESILSLETPSAFSDWLRGFVKKKDRTDDGLLNSASFCLQMSDKTTAETLFLELLRRTEGRSHAVYYALADIYRSRGDKEKAGICYRKILEAEPGNETAKNALAQLPADTPTIKNGVNQNQNEQEAIRFFNEANLKYKQGDVKGAVTSYEKAIRLNPGYYKAYNNLGILRASEMKDYAGALKDFEKAVEINPGYAEAYLGLGTCHYTLNDAGKACFAWQKAASLGSRQAEGMIRLYCK
jgi:tetratricopeptide (TPR) repeat protein